MEGSGVARHILETSSQSPARTIIYRYFEDPENVKALLRPLYALIRKSQIVQGDHQAVHEMAQELLNEIVEEVLMKCDRYDPHRELGPWLYGVAVNIVKRKKDEFSRRSQRETSFSNLRNSQVVTNDDEFFDQFVSLSIAGPEQNVEAEEQFTRLLACLSEGDQQVLHLTVLHDFDDVKLAKALGITRVAARQRIHRATTRLRSSLEEQEGESNG